MRVAITGSSGLIGSALVKQLTASGHTIVRLVRTLDAARQRDSCWWEPDQGIRQPEKLDGVDCLVHLAGRSIAQARWTRAEKARLVSSRVDATRILCDQLAALPYSPACFVSASAVGIYGDTGAGEVDEASTSSNDFLGQLAHDWEAASQPLEVVETRVVHARFGVVLAAEGGALAKLVPLFRFGLGGRIGNGAQYWSWVTLTDVVRALEWLITRDSCRGAFNITAPEPVTNSKFTRELAAALHRPAILPAPAFALRILLGEMADAALLASCRAVPKRLTQSGFQFEYPQLEAALEHILH